MKKTILMFLRAESLKPKAPMYHSLDTYLLRMMPHVNPRDLKKALNDLQDEGLAGFSGNWTVLGARFAGVEQGLKEVTIHAHLTEKGLDAANALANETLAARMEIPKTPEYSQPLTPQEAVDKYWKEKVIPEQPFLTAEPAAAEPAAAEPAAAEPAAAEPAAAEPAAAITAPQSSEVDLTKTEDLDDL